MKAQQNIPLVGQTPEQNHWPSVGIDHNLPFRHALTEASICTALILVIMAGGFVVVGIRSLALWGWMAFVSLIGFLFLLLKRYEDHIAYVRADRRPELPDLDLDADGRPDRVHGCWYGNGAPAAPAGSLDALYRVRFAEFVNACHHIDTTGRALRASGFDDNLQALFRNWLLQYGAANWLSSAGHNPGWELGDETVIRRVLKNTGWEAEG